MTLITARRARRACCAFVPPHVVAHVAQRTGMDTADPSAAQRTAVVSKLLREKRATVKDTARVIKGLGSLTGLQPGKGDRAIYDDKRTWEFDVERVRGEEDQSTGTVNVDQAHDHASAIREYYKAVHDRDSIDGNGMTINVNVNYGVDFLNAFWDGTRLTLGNGDGRTFVDFAQSPDVMGHEFSHGVVEHTANLDYQSQSGALNESFADVFGTLVEQRLKGEDFDSANWLIGDEIMAPDLYGEALRSMAHPGTAYDNTVLGKDPQPAHMRDYYAGPDDNQGVHINSGIVNRAFYLTAGELGTEGAGRIWYAGLQNLWPTANFADAADVLSAQARILARDGLVARQAAQVVRGTFGAVGIV
ncbi:MAG: M4 family metallopeptidase [Actinomycetota bacterium]|nr:M4 family metallopeptidase [Actinomycetota bacterium]